MWKKLRAWLGRENPHRKTDLLVLLFIGVLLLSCGSLFGSKEKEEPEETAAVETTPVSVFTPSSREEDLEKRLATILARVEGAGEVEVMVTLQNDSSQVVARDEKTGVSATAETDTTGDRREISENTTESTVVQLENGDGGTQPLVLTTEEAKVLGVVIVAKGADDILVRDALSRAAQALLDVPAHKVEILKMK